MIELLVAFILYHFDAPFVFWVIYGLLVLIDIAKARG